MATIQMLCEIIIKVIAFERDDMRCRYERSCPAPKKPDAAS
jgi:hypothetical protein